jgi:hypothetical protein
MSARSVLKSPVQTADVMTTPSSSPATLTAFSDTKGVRYCIVCKQYGGKVLEDGSCLSLHRIPDGNSDEKKALRAQWIKSLKLFRTDFPVNPQAHHRVCSQHFAGGYQPGKVPTLYKARKSDKAPRRLLIRASVPETSIIEVTSEEISDVINFVEPPISENLQCDAPEEPKTRDFGVQVGPPLATKYSDAGCQAKLPFVAPEDLKHQPDEKTRFYTGFVSFGMFLYMFNLMMSHGADKLNYWDGENSLKEKPYHQSNVKKPGPKRTLRAIDEFLMLCMKLRLNLLHETLGDLFCVSTSTVSRILNTWINFCYDHSLSLVTWPTLEKIMQCLPPHFNDYPHCTIILDCTEVFIEKPSSLSAQWLTWSEYKHHNTVKILIGVTPNGMVNFVSRLWGGRASDRHITQHDNFLPKLQPNTTIMADKGFTIEDLLPVDVGLNMPPRIRGQRQMTDTEVFQTTGIASPRIVCEMKMEQAKNYRIISGVIPLSEAHLAEQMIFLSFAWTNFQPPLLK